MELTQISVFLENEKGRLYETCNILGENDINIRALTIAETDGFGVLRMVVDNPKQAVGKLKEKNLVAKLTNIVAIEVEDKPGGLANVLKILTSNNVNVEYMYAFMEKFKEKALLVFRFQNNDNAIKILNANSIKVIDENDVINL